MPDVPPDLDHFRRQADESWGTTAVGHRCRTVASARRSVAAAVDQLVACSRSEIRTHDVDTVSAEVFPLCDALAFIGRRGPGVLQSRRVGLRGRPLWLWGVRSVVEREPHGVVLVLGAWNYPLLLGGVQVAQALAAGNAVLWKPAPGSESVCQGFAQCLLDAGVPSQALRVMDSHVSTAEQAIDAGVDLVVLTGSAQTGRAVLRRAAETLTPAIMELSGCDAAIVMSTADVSQAARAIRFGLTVNSGATCIGPRRLLLDERVADAFTAELQALLANHPALTVHPAARTAVIAAVEDALQRGANIEVGQWDRPTLEEKGQMVPLVLSGVEPDWSIATSDLFAPVASIQRYSGDRQAIDRCHACPYALAVSVFGDMASARTLSRQLRVGCVTINDLIVPTADPRLPFGGRGQSGFGVTRGSEGLLQMTTPKVTCFKRGSVAPHLEPLDSEEKQDATLETLLGALQLKHAGRLSDRWAGWKQMLRGVRNSRQSVRTEKEQGET